MLRFWVKNKPVYPENTSVMFLARGIVILDWILEAVYELRTKHPDSGKQLALWKYVPACF